MSPPEMELRVALITAPDVEVAAHIAGCLVEERLAACVNLVPGVRSIYRWEGRVQDDPEVMMVVKTRADRAAELSERVQALHPYEVPEVILLPVAGGSSAYLDWVRDQVSP